MGEALEERIALVAGRKRGIGGGIVRQRLVETVRAEWGPIDVLSDSAERAFYEPPHTISDKWLLRVLELNFIAPYDLFQRVIPGGLHARARV